MINLVRLVMFLARRVSMITERSHWLSARFNPINPSHGQEVISPVMTLPHKSGHSKLQFNRVLKTCVLSRGRIRSGSVVYRYYCLPWCYYSALTDLHSSAYLPQWLLEVKVAASRENGSRGTQIVGEE
ncbi:hypothetical protein RRG08_000919 [Elysia crispata]|uniref:Uncharacterized protein n=1 Tax=Elysia crispata TaxID=231223 RepID=A0AAE1DVA7_9GAST|nr:hypothetical protein RRG08_000919 [Elysia crispata]